MKLKSLLLGGLLVMSSSAFAALTVEQREYPRWTDPEIVKAPVFDGATEYSIYNLGGQGFLAGANDWNTRASIISETGKSSWTHSRYPWKVTEEDAENSCYSLSNCNTNGTTWKKMFANAADAIWVDETSQTNVNGWQFTASEGVYTITNTGFPDKVFAVKIEDGGAPASDTRAYFVDKDAAGYNSEWVFTTPDVSFLTTTRSGAALVTHNNEVAVWNASQALWKLMVEADGQGMQVPDMYQEIYAADTTSIATFGILVKEFQAEYDDYLVSIATLDKPVNVTSWFKVNNHPHRDDHGLEGWSVVFTGTGNNGVNHWNFWSNEGNSDGTNMTVDFYETWVAKGNLLSDQRHQIDTVRVRPGVYRVNARARCYSEAEGATEMRGAYLFANDFRTAFIDNSKGDASQKCQDQQEGLFSYNGMLGYYAPNANGFAIVPADGNEDGLGTITFGFYTKDANFNWVAHKDYKIEYLGNADDALLYVKNNSELTLEKLTDEDLVTKSMKEDFNDAYDAYVGATTGAEVSENYLAVSAMGAQIEKNRKAWVALVAAVQKAKVDVVDNEELDGPYREALSIDIMDFEDFIDPEMGYELTTQEVVDTTAYLLKRIEEAVTNDIAPGADITRFLVNPDFSQGTTGWQGKPTVNESCGEKYGSGSCDIYQEVNITKVGVYEISCQGFYRQYRMDNNEKEAWYNFFDKDGNVRKDAEGNRYADVLGWLYMNDNQTPLKSIFEEQIAVNTVMDGSSCDKDPLNDGAGMYWYPNNMKTAAQCFGATPEGTGEEDPDPYYTVHAKALLKEGDVMRIGVKATLGVKGNGNDWVIFDNFKLKYLGFPVDETKAILKEGLDNLEPYLEQVFDKDLKAEAQTAYNDGLAVYKNSESTGQQMFDAASAITAIVAKIPASVAKFDALNTAYNELKTAIDDAVASQEIIDEADEYAGKVNNITKGTTAATDTEADAAALKCAKYAGMLEVDDEAVPTAEKPVKYTPYLLSASFEKGGKNSIYGWEFGKQDKDGKDITPGGITSGQTKALAAEYYEKTYNMYQAVERLPQGMFQVSMKGFLRHTNAAKDWAQVIGDTASVAQFYVTVRTANNEVSGDTIFCPIRHITADATKAKIVSTDGANETTWQPFLLTDGDATAWHLPNDMLGAVDYFNYEAPNTSFYDNKINVMLNEGEVLVVGVKQDTCQAGDWVMMDNFQILYYGTDITGMEVGPQTSSCADYWPAVTDPIKDAREALAATIKVAQDTLATLSSSSAKRIEYLTAAIATAQDVYDNKDATLAELLRADAALKEAIVYIPEEGLKGDVNGDGVVDGTDIQEVINIMLAGTNDPVGDINKDGVVDGTDIQEIINIMLQN